MVILNAIEAPYTMPLASTCNRALTLMVEYWIRDIDGEADAFPLEMIPDIVRDTRLMQLIDGGAFDFLADGGAPVSDEWLEDLARQRPR